MVHGRGRLDGRLEMRVIPGSARCGRAKLAARGRQVVMACMPEASSGTFTVELWHSSDAGDSGRGGARRHMETRTPDAVGLAVSPDGRVLVTGLCESRPDAECAPAVPVLAHADPNAPAGPVRAPELEQTSAPPAFSGDGRAAYVLARARTGGALALFVSHDGGESFSARALDPPGSGGADDDAPGEHGGFDVHDRTAITTGEDGTVGMVLARPTGEVWVTATDDGRLLDVAYPESDGGALGGFGKRVVALGRATRDEDALALRESFDGGTTWHPAAHPRALFDASGDGLPAMACAAGGCLFGDSLARVGWALGARRGARGERTGARSPCCDRGGHRLRRIGAVDAPGVGGCAEHGPERRAAARRLARGAWLGRWSPRIAGALR
ncbi:MAG: sialidase family protein [Polyangiaceae bacterium]